MKQQYSPKDIVKSGLCIGCGICVTQTDSARMKFDAFGELKPSGSRQWFRQSSESFSKTCPFSPLAANEDQLASEQFEDNSLKNISIGYYQANYVGYVQEDEFRIQGSSGGLITWVAAELMQKGLVDGVAHVVATANPREEGRFFKFRISRTVKEIREGAKSRYYPVELSEVLKIIREVPGKYAVVAIPCMIKAINLLRRNDPVIRQRIVFTLGLFCGHMKSARFVESFAWQLNVPINDIKEVEFRQKYPDRPANWYNARLTLKDGRTVNKDWWNLKDGDWGAGFFMNSTCNYCDDVVAETADISFGDAWVEPYSKDGRGTNVVIVRSHPVRKLISSGIESGRLALTPVDAAFVEQTQAAGLRQRREGLSYRLTWHKKGIMPVKRVKPKAAIPKERKLIYRLRYFISKWSHRLFWSAKQLKINAVYLIWARAIAAVYYGIAYHKGHWKLMKQRYQGFKKSNG